MRRTESAGRLAAQGSLSSAGERRGNVEIDMAGLQGGAGLHVAERYVVEHNDIAGTLRAGR